MECRNGRPDAPRGDKTALPAQNGSDNSGSIPIVSESGRPSFRPRFWLLYVAGWALLGVWQGSNVLINFHNNGVVIAAWKPMCWEISSILLIGLLALGIQRVERRLPLTGPGWTRRLPWHVLAAVVFSLLHSIGMIGVRIAVYAWAGDRYDPGELPITLFYELQKDLVSYVVIAIACIALRTLRQRREQEALLLRTRAELDAARLSALTAQIQPHFVFNTLNAIANRMHEDVDAADRLLVAFADLLRSSLTADETPWSDAASEAAWLRRYFALFAERYRGQLQTSVEVGADALPARLPRLLLQPLAENAFRHGLPDGRGSVDVRIERDGERLRCTIDDDGAGIAAGFRDGLGLGNVRRRLQLLYPGAHKLEIARRAGGGSRVELELPFEQP